MSQSSTVAVYQSDHEEVVSFHHADHSALRAANQVLQSDCAPENHPDTCDTIPEYQLSAF